MNKKPQKSLKLNVLINCLRIGLNTIFPMITFPYISRILGPDNLGKTSFASSVINYFVLLASLGIPSYGVLVCAKARDKIELLKKTICELLYINIAVMLAAYFLFICSLLTIPKFQESRQLLLINSVSIIATAVGLDWLYSAMEDFWYITVRSIAFKLISLILILSFIRRSDDYYIYAAILVFSTVGSNLFNLLHARKYIKFYPISELNLRQHIRPILSLFSASVAGTISANTDTVMLGFFMGTYEVGLYSFSVKVKNLLSTVMTAGLTVFVPRFSYYVKENLLKLYREQIRKVVLLTFSVACALATFSVAYAREIIAFLGGEEYVDARPSMMILTGCIIVLAFTWTLGVGVLQPLGCEQKYAKGMLCGCCINVFFNLVLIPHYGVVGAAIATFASESVIMIVYYLEARSFLNGCLAQMRIELIVAVAVISAIGARLLTNHLVTSALLTLIIGLMVYMAVYIILIMTCHKELRTTITNIVKPIIKKQKGLICL